MGAIRDYFVANGVEVKDGSSPEELRVCCGFCHQRGFTPDNKFRLGINERTGWAHCFNCGFKSGDFYELLKSILGVRLFKVASDEVAKKPVKVSLPKGFELLSRDPYKPAVSYLKRRGLTWKQIVGHRIGYCLSGRYRYRVVFPLFYGKKLVSYVTRDFSGLGSPPYLNSKGPRAIFNFNSVSSRRVVFVSEGIIKALAIERVMPSGCCSVCTLGNKATHDQVSAIVSKKPKAVVLFPDPGYVGMLGYRESAAAFSTSVPTFVTVPLPTKQADEYTDAELRTVIGKVERYSPAMSLAMELEACSV